jgi:hypothetical protein
VVLMPRRSASWKPLSCWNVQRPGGARSLTSLIGVLQAVPGDPCVLRCGNASSSAGPTGSNSVRRKDRLVRRGKLHEASEPGATARAGVEDRVCLCTALEHGGDREICQE